MSLRLQPVKVATGSADEESRLVFEGDFLVAILVRLSADHDADAGKWFLEVGFGRVAVPLAPVFNSLDAAGEWISALIASRP